MLVFETTYRHNIVLKTYLILSSQSTQKYLLEWWINIFLSSSSFSPWPMQHSLYQLIMLLSVKEELWDSELSRAKCVTFDLVYAMVREA